MNTTTDFEKVILKELKEIRRDLDYIKKIITEIELGDFFLTADEEEMVRQSEKDVKERNFRNYIDIEDL